MPATSLVELLVSGRQREADLLYRQQIRRKPFLLYPNSEEEPRVLRLVAGDLATTYLGGDGHEPGALMDGHWEADHFLIERKLGTIVGCVFDDSDPARLVRFLHARERQIIVNCIADPDLYPKTLAVAEQLVRMARLPTINSPASILRHSRDAVARTLRGIANLIVPETIRLTARTGQQPPFAYPFIGRKCGTQGGQTMELIGDTGEFDTFLRRRDGQQVYLTESSTFVRRTGSTESIAYASSATRSSPTTCSPARNGKYKDMHRANSCPEIRPVLPRNEPIWQSRLPTIMSCARSIAASASTSVG
jgi:hypothetical protein